MIEFFSYFRLKTSLAWLSKSERKRPGSGRCPSPRSRCSPRPTSSRFSSPARPAGKAGSGWSQRQGRRQEFKAGWYFFFRGGGVERFMPLDMRHCIRPLFGLCYYYFVSSFKPFSNEYSLKSYRFHWIKRDHGSTANFHHK